MTRPGHDCHLGIKGSYLPPGFTNRHSLNFVLGLRYQHVILEVVLIIILQMEVKLAPSHAALKKQTAAIFINCAALATLAPPPLWRDSTIVRTATYYTNFGCDPTFANIGCLSTHFVPNNSDLTCRHLIKRILMFSFIHQKSYDSS